MAGDFPDADLIGIEITGEYIARCNERLRSGEYGQSFIHFHQRNMMDEIFEPESIDVTLCNSTLHEIWSYGEQEKSVKDYLKKKFRQTKRGGRLIVRDVVGAYDKYREVYMLCNDTDGTNDLRAPVDELSTYANFLKFSEGFLEIARRSGRRGAETKEDFY